MIAPVISYHYPCPDGVFAALAAHLRFAELGVTPVWVPNTVYSPRRLQDLHIQVDRCAKPGITDHVLPCSAMLFLSCRRPRHCIC